MRSEWDQADIELDGAKKRAVESATVLESDSESDSDSDSDSYLDPGGEVLSSGASRSSGAEWSGAE